MKLLVLLATLWIFLYLHWEKIIAKTPSLSNNSNSYTLLQFNGDTYCGNNTKQGRPSAGTEHLSRHFSNKYIVITNTGSSRQIKSSGDGQDCAAFQQLSGLYNPTDHMPFTVLLDAEGAVVKTWESSPDSICIR